MAPNDRRKQKTSSKEESAYVVPWQNLPEKLLNFIEKQLPHSKIVRSTGFPGISKSWRCASKKCDSIAQSPWLELSNEPQYYCKTQQYTFSVSFEEVGNYLWHGKRRPRYDPWNYFHYYSPWSLVKTEKIHNQKWMREDSSHNGLIDPNDPKRQLILFTNAIIFEWKVYALSLQGTLAEIESQIQVTRLSRKRAIPSSYSKHFIEYFLVSNGEILLIFLISERSNKMVDKVEVFKLQIEDLTWLKLDNLGDRSLFAGINCCLSVHASQMGCRNNCIYFTHHGIDSWRLYDMRSGCIFPFYDDDADPVWEEPIIIGKSSRRRW